MSIITIEDWAKFCLQFLPLLSDLYEALTMGADEARIRQSIRDAKVAASDAQMKAELGLPETPAG